MGFHTTMMECKNDDAISKDQNQKNTNLACELPFCQEKNFSCMNYNYKNH